jgi:hypothetical protein
VGKVCFSTDAGADESSKYAVASRGVRPVVGGFAGGGVTGGGADGLAVGAVVAGFAGSSVGSFVVVGLVGGASGSFGVAGLANAMDGVGAFATGDVGVFAGGVGSFAADGVVARADHNGSVRGGTRSGRVGGGVVFANGSELVLRVELGCGGKSFVPGFRNDAVTRRGDNGLVGGLVVIGGGRGEVRRVESGPVGGLPVVVVGVAGAGVRASDEVARRAPAPARPVAGLLSVADSAAVGACDKLVCSLLKISCARVFVWLNFVTSSIACCTCPVFAPTINSYKSSAPFTSMNFNARAKSRRA